MKVQQINKWGFLISLVSLFVTGCGLSTLKQPVSENDCIGSFYQNAYTRPFNEYASITPVLPNGSWERRVEIDGMYSKIKKNIVGARLVDGEIEIWIKIGSENGSYLEADSEYYKFAIFRPNTNSWQFIPAQVQDTPAFAYQLFFLADGSIVAKNIWAEKEDITDYPILSRFNKNFGGFEFIEESIGIPPKGNGRGNNGVLAWDTVVQDRDDNLWIFSQNYGVYKFYTDTRVFELRISEFDDLLYNAVYSVDEKIYLYVKSAIANSIKFENDELFQVDLHTNTISSLPIPDKKWPGFENIYSDHLGKIWLSVVGWRDQDGTWKLLYPDTKTYFYNLSQRSDTRWRVGNVLMEDSFGRMWFENYMGLSWYDPELEKGCWVTTFRGSVIEDSQRNIWILVDNALFFLPPNTLEYIP